MHRLDRLFQKMPNALGEIFLIMTEPEKKALREIRLRTGRPVTICSDSGIQILKSAPPINPENLRQTVASLCDFSVYTHSETIGEGFITLADGHRVGFCGTRNSMGKVDSSSVSSLNIRIAREIPGCARSVVEATQLDALHALLLFGKPCSGKTTWLRDLARTLSSPPFLYNCVLIDERGEIAAMEGGRSPFSLGICCDVLDRYPRAAAFDIALRTLSPQVILCDEIGLSEDFGCFCECAKSGVKLIATAHAENVQELYRRKNIAAMLEAGAFEYLAGLMVRKGKIQLESIYKVVS